MVIGYWEVLGIESTADITAIKKAYASGVKKYHPEEHPDEFQQLQKAYKMALRYAKQYQSKQTPKEQTNGDSDNTKQISQELYDKVQNSRELDNKEQSDTSTLSEESLSKVALSSESSKNKSSQDRSFDSTSQIYTIPQNLFDEINITSYRHTVSTEKEEDTEQFNFKVVEECSEEELIDKKIMSFMKEYKRAFREADNLNKDTYWRKLFSTAQFKELQANPKFTEEFLNLLAETKELFDAKLWKIVFIPMLSNWPWPSKEISQKFHNQLRRVKKPKPKNKFPILIIILSIWYTLYLILQVTNINDTKNNNQKYIAADETTDSKTSDKPEPQIVKKNHDGTYFFTEKEVNKILKNSEKNLGTTIYVKSSFSDDYNETSYYELYFFICVEESDNVYVEVYRKYDNNKIEQTVSMLSEKTKKQNVFPEGLEGYEFTGNYDYKNNNK